ISASSRSSQVSSSIFSKTEALISSASAWRLFERLSRRRRKTPRRCSGSASAGCSIFAGSREPRSIISCQLVAIARGGYRRGRGGGGGRPLGGRRLHVRGGP